jgi:predicted acetyltransferase
MTTPTLTLSRADLRYEASFLAMADEFIAARPEDDYARRYHDLKVRVARDGFHTLVAESHEQEMGINLPPGYVPGTDLWLIENGVEVVGRGNFRHFLNPWLERMGGHIGYEIRPSRRRRGYGTAILRLMLDEARAFGLDRALVTCHPDNTGSKKIIERNGGVLQDTIWIDELNRPCSRYWISLSPIADSFDSTTSSA